MTHPLSLFTSISKLNQIEDLIPKSIRTSLPYINCNPDTVRFHSAPDVASPYTVYTGKSFMGVKEQMTLTLEEATVVNSARELAVSELIKSVENLVTVFTKESV